jgi:predicted deacylase
MTFGRQEILRHVDGGAEELPVVIACGKRDGPCLWVTANIHGDEYVGLLAVQRAVTRDLAGRLGELRGTVVAIPTLNPAGLRVGRRQAYYDSHTDPNRTFPDAAAEEIAEEIDEEEPPTPYAQASAVYFDLLRQTATYLIDLHAMDIQATPFTIRDRVLYRDEDGLPEAERLAERLDGLARSFGAPVVNEYGAQKYLKQRLQRSTAGAALHVAGIPAITPELGMGGDVDPLALRAGIAGIHNTLVWAEMLTDDPIVMDWIAQPDLGYSVTRLSHPRVPEPGIVAPLVRPGEIVRAGQPVAELTDIWGRQLGEDGLIRTEHEGWVLSLRSGAQGHRHRPVLELAIRDNEPLVQPWPEG